MRNVKDVKNWKFQRSMPPICDAILRRRAIKQYTKESVSIEAIEYLRKVAVAIPTGHNTRHTEFAFVTNPRIIKTISQAKGEKQNICSMQSC